MPSEDENKAGAPGAENNNGQQEGSQADGPKTSLEALNTALDNMPPEGGIAAPAAGGTEEKKEPAAGAEGGAAPAAGGEGDKGPQGAASTAKPGEKKPEEKKPEPGKDDELYKMPDGLAEKSKERFQKLVTANQEKDTLILQKDQQIADMQGATTWLRENVLTDEQAPHDLLAFADYRNAIKSGNIDKAEAILKEQIKGFTLMTGRSLTADPLADFPELRQKVKDLELDEASALELARSRQAAKVTQQNQQQEQTQRQQKAQLQQAVDTAIGEVDKMAAQWAKTDPDWPAKEKILMERLPDLQRTIPVHLLPQQVKILYDSLSSLAANGQQGQQGSNVAPLRASGGGGGRAAPQSSLEALDQALGYT